MSLSVSRNAVSALHIRLVRRNLSSAPGPSNLDSKKAFSKTLLLLKTHFPLWADPAKSEELFRRKTCDELYQWQVRYAYARVVRLILTQWYFLGAECQRSMVRDA